MEERWNVVEHCRDFLVGCDPREATGASMAVPLLVNLSMRVSESRTLSTLARGALSSLNRAGQVVDGWQLEFHADPLPMELGGGLRAQPT